MFRGSGWFAACSPDTYFKWKWKKIRGTAPCLRVWMFSLHQVMFVSLKMSPVLNLLWYGAEPGTRRTCLQYLFSLNYDTMQTVEFIDNPKIDCSLGEVVIMVSTSSDSFSSNAALTGVGLASVTKTVSIHFWTYS